MNIKSFIKYLKTCLVGMNINLVTLTSFITYLIMSFTSVCSFSANDKIIEILGGFSLNQPPLSIYILLWLIPKLMLFYLIVLFINSLFHNTLPMIILRVKSKSLWFITNNLIVFLAIVLWYMIGYIVVIFTTYIKFKKGLSVEIQYFKMLGLDILATYCILNIFYIIIIITNKIIPAITVVLTIYISTMFTNNPYSIIFKILPTNYQMFIRQQYVFNSFSYLCITSIMIFILCIFFIKKNELLFEGV